MVQNWARKTENRERPFKFENLYELVFSVFCHQDTAFATKAKA